MMNPEDKIAWIAALRSGKYQQTDGALRVNDSFCCLGVLCALKEVPFRVVKGEDEDAYEFTFEDGSEFSGSIPVDFCGIEHDVQETLIAMNDVDHRTFPEIADYIEKNL